MQGSSPFVKGGFSVAEACGQVPRGSGQAWANRAGPAVRRMSTAVARSTLLAMLPSIAIFILLQKFIVPIIIGGAVKE